MLGKNCLWCPLSTKQQDVLMLSEIQLQYHTKQITLDAKEKLAMHACDGYTGKWVSFASMPVKNNSLTYEHIYRYAITFIFDMS